MKRGDIVLAVAQGDYGKPRPAVIVQSDLFNPTHASLLVCLLTTDLIHAPLFRLPIAATPANGLRERRRSWSISCSPCVVSGFANGSASPTMNHAEPEPVAGVDARAGGPVGEGRP